MAQVFHVRSWRNKMGWSRKEAADHLGLSVHTIKSYELHRRDLSKPIQQLMERLEEEQNNLGLGTASCPHNTFSPVLIVGGVFAQPITSKQDTNEQSTSSTSPLMAFRPGSCATSHELHSICTANGTQASLLISPLLTPQSFTLQTVNDLRDQLFSLKPQHPKVMLFPCTVPHSVFAFEAVKDILYDYAVKPIVISFYSFEEHGGLAASNNLEQWVASLPSFGQYLFVEKRCDASTELLYCVINNKGKAVLSWEQDKELVMAQLLALTCPQHDMQGDSASQDLTQENNSSQQHPKKEEKAHQSPLAPQGTVYQAPKSSPQQEKTKENHLLP